MNQKLTIGFGNLKKLNLDMLSEKDTIKSTWWEASNKLLFWSLCGMFFCLPLATAPAAITGGLSLIVWIFSGKVYRDRRQWLNQSWFIPVLLFILFHFIGLLWTKDMGTGIYYTRRTYYWLYAGAIASLAFDKNTMKYLINCFLAGLSITAIISILQFLHLYPLKGDMPTAYIGHITHTLFLVFGILVVSFYFSKTSNTKTKTFLLLLMILYIIAMLVGWGRAGYLAFVILSPWIGYNLLGQKHKWGITAISLACVCILFLSPTVRSRTALMIHDIRSYENSDPNTSIGWRIFMWNGAVKIFLENPWTGTGTGGYQTAMRKYETPQISSKFNDLKDPHNIFLYMAINFGILGLIVMIWLFYILVSKSWRQCDNLIGFTILAFTLVTFIGNFSVATTVYTATGQLFLSSPDS
jgi:O-antigen ligase